MSKNAVSVGFRIKSGWATTIFLQGPSRSPKVLERRVVELCDPAIPDCRQPWHAAEGMPEAEGEKVVSRLRKLVLRFAYKSVSKLIDEYKKAGHKFRAAGLVVGSDIDPMKLKNAHIRAHALEGRLFRTAVEEALQSSNLPFLVVVERDAFTKASKTLNRSQEELKTMLADFGRSLKGPWRTDEKVASLAAWMALSR